MNITTRNRSDLKVYFKKQAIPTEAQFAELIDGMINQREDGLIKQPNSPLTIGAVGDAQSPKKVLDLYQSLGDANPEWSLGLRHPASGKAGLNVSDSSGTSRLFIDRDTGNLGVGTATPAARLHVNGNLQVSGDVQVTGTVVSENWRPLTLQNGWVYWGDVNTTPAGQGNYSRPGYCKDSMGFAHLRGLLWKTSGAATGTVVATLPVGYRPEYRSIFAVEFEGAGGTSGRIDICTNGDVVLWLPGAVSSIAHISLENIVFRAFQ